MELTDFFKKYIHVPDDVPMSEILSVSEMRKLVSGEYLIRQGEINHHLNFLIQGIVRGSMIDINGKDITDCIVFQCGSPIMPDNDFGGPASTALEALEDSVIVSIPLEKVQTLLTQYPSLNNIYQYLLLNSANLHRTLKIVTYQYTAAQRYQWFLENYPGIIDRVSHKYIASFLNMTPVTLSKVRTALKVTTHV